MLLLCSTACPKTLFLRTSKREKHFKYTFLPRCTSKRQIPLVEPLIFPIRQLIMILVCRTLRSSTSALLWTLFGVTISLKFSARLGNSAMLADQAEAYHFLGLFRVVLHAVHRAFALVPLRTPPPVNVVIPHRLLLVGGFSLQSRPPASSFLATMQYK